VLRAGGIAGGGTTPCVLLIDEFFDGEGLVRRVAPEFLTDLEVQPLGATFGETIGEGLNENLAERGPSP